MIEVRPIMGQIDDLVGEINERVEKDQRVFVTTLTKNGRRPHRLFQRIRDQSQIFA